jgi:predicted nucleic acid-binding protein
VKRERAIEALRRLWDSGAGRLSPPVLQEFYVNATQKLKAPVTRSTAREVVGAYGTWIRELTTADTITRASDIAELAQLSFWDALILAAAEQVNAAELYSEDLNENQVIAGIRIVNPLA